MKKLILFLLFILLMFSCAQQHDHKGKRRIAKSMKVSCYRTHVNNSDNDFLFWYLIWSGTNNSSCYYYSSPTIVNDFSTVNWTKSSTNPIEDYPKDQVEQLAEEQVPVESMDTEMQAEINENAENFSGLTEEEMGDYEGGGEVESQSDGSSDGGSSSDDGGGSSSDGGGDSGGGDGGGGGE